jgi:serine/threonine protein kinase
MPVFMNNRSDCQTEYYYVGALVDERYRLTEFIGAGGMACVYRAQEEGSPHHYAIKFLKDEYHGQEYLIDYFRDEAGSMRDLAHPNIVRFYRFVNKAAYSYIVMDYVDGFALSDVLKRIYKQQRDMPLDEVVRIMTQVARALDAIHREGYVHRDIKPSNVLIERLTGQTFLTDLGITTTANTRMEGAGTLAYMPPELAETWVADHRADIYSFAIMYFELLGKQRPFRVDKGLRGKDAEANLLGKHKAAPVPDLTAYRADLPPALNGIMRKALAKQPQDRYESIVEFARDIHNALKPHLSADLQDFATISHRQIAAPEASIPQRTNPMMLWGMIAGVIAIITAGFILINLLNGNTIFGSVPAATSTATSTVTPTATPNPLVGLPVFNDFLSGASALAEPVAWDTLVVPVAEDGSLQYLRVGREVNGFSVTMVVANTENVARYGLAFRVQDAENYLLYTLEPDSGEWVFAEVVNGEAAIIENGTLATVPQRLIISGYGAFYQVDLGAESLEFESDQFATGSLALFIEGEGALLTLDNLTVALIGTDAEHAAATTPTPSVGIADPRRFLLGDIEALLHSNDIANSAINCPAYIEEYESLERHLDSADSNIRQLAQETIDVGEVVYTRCRSESPNAPLSFVTAIQDYLEWEENLRGIQDELGE